MINWLSVVGSSFWVAGLALMLAGLSYYHWMARQLDRPLRQVMSEPRFQAVLMSGLLLVGVGLVITAGNPWQTIPAGALILICLLALVAISRDNRRQRRGE